MNKTLINNIFRFIGLLLLQVLILNHINLFGFINPMVYIVFVILYPIKKKKTLFLVLSFLLGLAVDVFSDSGGINAAATLCIAYFRLSILNTILRKTEFDYLLFNLRAISFGKALLFISILTVIHHFIVFSLEYFSFSSIIPIISNTIQTSIFTILISVLGIIIFSKKK